MTALVLASLGGAILGGLAVAWSIGGRLIEAHCENVVLQERVHQLTADADADFERVVSDAAQTIGGTSWI